VEVLQFLLYSFADGVLLLAHSCASTGLTLAQGFEFHLVALFQGIVIALLTGLECQPLAAERTVSCQ